MEHQSKSPFKFLDSYSKEDYSTFFGRDDEISELYYRVFKHKILVQKIFIPIVKDLLFKNGFNLVYSFSS